jgi:site-specific DNA-cytosine methylase
LVVDLFAGGGGAPTIRKRLFLVARRDGMPIVWPEATHGAPDSLPVKQKKLKPWRTAAECIDWSVPAPSIFERSKPLADATCRRIAKGIMRYVVNAADPFIVDGAAPFLTEHANASHQRTFPADEPLRTQVAQVKGGHFALVAPTLVQTGYGEREGQAPRALDIGLRMLTPRELYRAQGFPEAYAIDKGADGRPLTKTAQVRMCGNSVCPPLARALVAANYAEAEELRVAA